MTDKSRADAHDLPDLNRLIEGARAKAAELGRAADAIPTTTRTDRRAERHALVVASGRETIIADYLERMRDALAPLVAIAAAYEANNLDDEARRFWGKELETENTTPSSEIELYSGRGGKRLLTLAHCFAARDALAGSVVKTPETKAPENHPQSADLEGLLQDVDSTLRATRDIIRKGNVTNLQKMMEGKFGSGWDFFGETIKGVRQFAADHRIDLGALEPHELQFRPFRIADHVNIVVGPLTAHDGAISIEGALLSDFERGGRRLPGDMGPEGAFDQAIDDDRIDAVLARARAWIAAPGVENNKTLLRDLVATIEAIRPIDVAAEYGSPIKRWPFAESPGDFAGRLWGAYCGKHVAPDSVLAAVRTVLIENPPILADWTIDVLTASRANVDRAEDPNELTGLRDLLAWTKEKPETRGAMYRRLVEDNAQLQNAIDAQDAFDAGLPEKPTIDQIGKMLTDWIRSDDRPYPRPSWTIVSIMESEIQRLIFAVEQERKAPNLADADIHRIYANGLTDALNAAKGHDKPERALRAIRDLMDDHAARSPKTVPANAEALSKIVDAAREVASSGNMSGFPYGAVNRLVAACLRIEGAKPANDEAPPLVQRKPFKSDPRDCDPLVAVLGSEAAILAEWKFGNLTRLGLSRFLVRIGYGSSAAIDRAKKIEAQWPSDVEKLADRARVLTLSLEKAFPHFQLNGDVPDYAATIEAIGKDWENMTTNWGPIPLLIDFVDADGNAFKIVYDFPEEGVGLNGGWVLEDGVVIESNRFDAMNTAAAKARGLLSSMYATGRLNIRGPRFTEDQMVLVKEIEDELTGAFKRLPVRSGPKAGKIDAAAEAFATSEGLSPAAHTPVAPSGTHAPDCATHCRNQALHKHECTCGATP